MEMSASINELATALALAQGEVAGAAKTSQNPFYKSRYADLESVWDACRKPLTDHGLSIVQSPSTELTEQGGLRVAVETLLLHASGQWIRGVVSVSAKEDSPQAVGSCISYLKRYALQSFAGVAPSDDDAEAAQGRGNGQTARPVAVVTAPKGFEDWILDLTALTDEGIVKFRQAWKDAKPEYRDYLMKANPKQLDALADKAKKVTAAKSESVSA